MARLKLAPHLLAMSGRMASVVYKVTRFGTEMAEFEAPSNPNTPAQQTVRNNFRKSAQQWRTLTSPQAAAWRAYAATKHVEEEITTERYKPTGFNMFVKLAAKWFAVNPNQSTAPSNPPTSSFAGDTISLIASSEGAGTIEFTASGANAANMTTAILFQRVSGPNSVPVDGAYKIAKYFRFQSGSLSTTISVPPGYYAVGYQFVNTATGQTVTPVHLANLVGPVGFTMVSSGTSGKSKKAA
ncbi:MAG TPA: hypothetical protein PLL78_02745 [Fimbriimonadaceae bacterium]|nr:hypothetical protein [Fimbriimonadaceae bacterium]HRJ95578.1 hypothetical protein [Fimbriimonadaceae bacterium]